MMLAVAAHIVDSLMIILSKFAQTIQKIPGQPLLTEPMQVTISAKGWYILCKLGLTLHVVVSD